MFPLAIAPLKLSSELSISCRDLACSDYAKPKVKIIALEAVLDMFDHLPPDGVATICPSHPINLSCPQGPTSLHAEYTSMLIVDHAMVQSDSSPTLSGVVWVWDNTQFLTTKSSSIHVA